MNPTKLAAVTLEDPTGAPQRLGEYWAERPVVLVFLRHFGCLLCREHAAQLGEQYEAIRARGGEVVAVGTGNHRYAQAFIDEEHVPFPVLVDDRGEAADAAAVRSVNFFTLLFSPKSWPGARRAHKAGHKVHKAGKRVTQLGATFVVGPGERIRYEHVDEHSADHAPLDEVMAALR